MSTMEALVGGAPGTYQLAVNVEIPQPQPGQLLCRVHAVSLNPVDQKIIDYTNAPDAVGGCDFAGTVVQVGKVCRGSKWATASLL